MIRISIQIDGVRHSTELNDGVEFGDIVHEIDGLARRVWPSAMEHRRLRPMPDTPDIVSSGLGNTGGSARHGATPTYIYRDPTVTGRDNAQRFYGTEEPQLAQPSISGVWGTAEEAPNPIRVGYVEPAYERPRAVPTSPADTTELY